MIECNYHVIEIVCETSEHVLKVANKGRIIPIDAYNMQIWLAATDATAFFSEYLRPCKIRSIEYMLTARKIGVPRLYQARLNHQFDDPLDVSGVDALIFRTVKRLFKSYRIAEVMNVPRTWPVKAQCVQFIG